MMDDLADPPRRRPLITSCDSYTPNAEVRAKCHYAPFCAALDNLNIYTNVEQLQPENVLLKK